MDMRRFLDFWKGMFYLVSTLAVSVVLYLVVFIWQPLWTEGFRNFGQISESIMRLDRTAKPVAEMAPLILAEMDAIRLSMEDIQGSMEVMEELNPSVKQLDITMNRMNWVMDTRMGVMTHQMDRVNDKMSPAGMMPFNW